MKKRETEFLYRSIILGCVRKTHNGYRGGRSLGPASEWRQKKGAGIRKSKYVPSVKVHDFVLEA